jgi:hypothetical protein
MPLARTRPCQELLAAFHGTPAAHRPRQGAKLIFAGTKGRDVYNCTAPFSWHGESLIAARVESRDDEFSQVMFFTERQGTWVQRPHAPVFDLLQDPCVTQMGDELVLGGVSISVDAAKHSVCGWRTVFYRGRTIESLTPFARGPEEMKDIRLRQLPGGGIAVATRPFIKGQGTIGFTILRHIDELDADALAGAPLFVGQFADQEWGGANELHVLRNGSLGVLGHMACWDAAGNGVRHYYPMAFVIDSVNWRHTPPVIIAERAVFPVGPAKRQDLQDVVFSSGLVRQDDGTALLYAGLSDCEVGVVRITDPFIGFEQH